MRIKHEHLVGPGFACFACTAKGQSDKQNSLQAFTNSRPAEGAGQRAAAAVGAAGRVLRCEQHEVRVWPHRLPQFRHVQLPVVVQQPADCRKESLCLWNIMVLHHLPKLAEVLEADSFVEQPTWFGVIRSLGAVAGFCVEELAC